MLRKARVGAGVGGRDEEGRKKRRVEEEEERIQ